MLWVFFGFNGIIFIMVMVFLMVDVSVCPVVVECRISGLRIFEFSNVAFLCQFENSFVFGYYSNFLNDISELW